MAEFERKNLWAPWRMEYIDGLGHAADQGCFLCRAFAAPDDDEANHVIWRDARVFALLNKFPYTSGHVLVAPAAHVGEPEDLPDDVLLDLLHRTRDAKRVIQAALHAQGFNIGMNLGRRAGAGLPGHLHMHVVPRWSGDVNFMAVLGDVKVIPESLARVHTLLRDKAAELGV